MSCIRARSNGEKNTLVLCVKELLNLELFQQLPLARLDWICARADKIEITVGETLFKEGEQTNGFFVLMAGRMEIVRYSEGIEMPIGQHVAPAFFGEISVLSEEANLVTIYALTDCRIYKISGEDFLELLHECRAFEREIFRVVQRRVRGLESFIRSREKMAALGTLASGLTHELNNPAAAVVRALKDIIPATIELQRMSLLYGQRNVEEEHTRKWLEVRDNGYRQLVNAPLSPLELSEREEEIQAWLEDYGVENAWNLAAPLALGGIEISLLEELMAPWRDDPTELRDQGLRWLALSFDVMSMLDSGLRSSERILELVNLMKSHSHLDRGARQVVDVHDGLEDTLKLLSPKLKQGIEVRRAFDRTIPKILAYGSELNQVWIGSIDNAIEAMGGKGILELTTSIDGSHVRVEIVDSGRGIPVEIQSRIFEPFFTTKPVGEGFGLGLDAVRRIVENRHQGTISFESRPGRTCFTICLPLNVKNRSGSS